MTLSSSDVPITLEQGKFWTHQTTCPSSIAAESILYALQLIKAFFPQLTSLITSFLKDMQPFSPNPLGFLHIVHVEMLFLSLPNIALSSDVIFLWSDFTKRSPIMIIQDFFPTIFLKRKWWIPTIIPVFNPLLVVSEISLDDLTSQTDQHNFHNNRMCLLAWLFKKREATHFIGWGLITSWKIIVHVVIIQIMLLPICLVKSRWRVSF